MYLYMYVFINLYMRLLQAACWLWLVALSGRVVQPFVHVCWRDGLKALQAFILCFPSSPRRRPARLSRSRAALAARIREYWSFN